MENLTTPGLSLHDGTSVVDGLMATVPPDEVMEVFLEAEIGNALSAYGSLILGIVGIVGNLLILVVLARKPRLSTTDVYLINLAVVDLLYNVVHRIYRFVPKGFAGVDLIQLHPWLCKTWAFSVMVFMTVSGWTIMAVTLERLLVVYFPLRVQRMLTRRVAVAICLSLDALWCGVYAIYFWTYGALYKNTAAGPVLVAGCNPFAEMPSTNFYHKKVRFLQDFFSLVGVPFIFIIICNGLIVVKMLRRSNQMIKLSDAAEIQRQAKTKALTFTLMTVSIVYLVCLTPYRVVALVSTSGSPMGKKVTSHAIAVDVLRWSIATVIAHINYAVNIFLYCLCGQEFRKLFLALFRDMFSCCWKKRSNTQAGRRETEDTSLSQSIARSSGLARALPAGEQQRL